MSRTEGGQQKVTTIWLEAEIGPNGDRKKMFYCFNCRIPIIQYQGNIMVIVPGNTPYQPATLLKCKGNVQREDGTWEKCGHYYFFMGTVYTANPNIE